ncbi:MAG: DUF459 domain-containing protein [Nostoc sp.]|uniref:DUF459 domain-containing protein n=1 Tax=Nostoc sp. TaxID=1180 RepID=UPI002FF0DDCF
MQDLKFLMLSGLVGSSLISLNFPVFLKSLSSSHLVNAEIKQAAQQVKLEGFGKAEQEFWNRIKEFGNEPEQIAESPKLEIKPPQPSPEIFATPFLAAKSNTRLQPTSNHIQSLFLARSSELQPIVNTPKLTNQVPYKRFLLTGDSIMYSLSVAFENAVKKTDYDFDKITIAFKISTGLNRIDFYDWYSHTRELIKQNHPDVMVVVFGGNDDQSILDVNKKFRAELTPDWEKAYEERVERYARLLDGYSVRKVYWMGHPISNLARYNKFFPIFNRIYKKVAQVHPKIEFIDTWNAFAVNGNFSPVVADNTGKRGRVRINDGVHPTEHGAKILIDILKQKMISDGVLKPKIQPVKKESIN